MCLRVVWRHRQHVTTKWDVGARNSNGTQVREAVCTIANSSAALVKFAARFAVRSTGAFPIPMEGAAQSATHCTTMLVVAGPTQSVAGLAMQEILVFTGAKISPVSTRPTATSTAGLVLNAIGT